MAKEPVRVLVTGAAGITRSMALFFMVSLFGCSESEDLFCFVFFSFFFVSYFFVLVAFLSVETGGYCRSCDLHNYVVESVVDLKKLGINRGVCCSFCFGA